MDNSAVKGIGYQVNDLLSDYILLHNRVFSGALRNIFHPIPFEDLYKNSKDIELELQKCLHQMMVAETVEKSSDFPLNVALREFIQALLTTLGFFQQLMMHLDMKAKKNKSHSLLEYKKYLQHYREAEKDHISKGKILNKVFL